MVPSIGGGRRHIKKRISSFYTPPPVSCLPLPPVRRIVFGEKRGEEESAKSPGGGACLDGEEECTYQDADFCSFERCRFGAKIAESFFAFSLAFFRLFVLSLLVARGEKEGGGLALKLCAWELVVGREERSLLPWMVHFTAPKLRVGVCERGGGRDTAARDGEGTESRLFLEGANELGAGRGREGGGESIASRHPPSLPHFFQTRPQKSKTYEGPMKETYVQYSTRRKIFHDFGSGKERTSYLLTHVICMKRIAVDFGRGGARAFFVNFPLSLSPFFARALTLSFQEKGFFFFPLQPAGDSSRRDAEREKTALWWRWWLAVSGHKSLPSPPPRHSTSPSGALSCLPPRSLFSRYAPPQYYCTLCKKRG